MKNKIEMVEIGKIIPYINNPVIHSEEQVKKIASSIKEFGFINPIILDKDNVIIAGHGRLEAAKLLKLDKVPCLRAEHLTPAQVKAYRIADNRLQEMSEWDTELLKVELEELEEAGVEKEILGFEDDDELIVGFENETEEEKLETVYSRKIEAPIYKPSTDKKISASELVDEKKTNKLIKEIESKKIPEDIKRFLKLSAYRHLEFDYSKIADFYAQADKEVQELMEKSALVIIDFDKAIEYGFVKMTKKVLELMEE